MKLKLLNSYDLEHFSFFVVVDSVDTFVWFYGMEFSLGYIGPLETSIPVLQDLCLVLGMSGSHT